MLAAPAASPEASAAMYAGMSMCAGQACEHGASQ